MPRLAAMAMPPFQNSGHQLASGSLSFSLESRNGLLSSENPDKLIRPGDPTSIVIRLHLYPALLMDFTSSAYLTFFLKAASSKRVSERMVTLTESPLSCHHPQHYIRM